ncbi:sulfatase [Leeuwenhoekiella parthenopeia]|uniref:Sulfatase n=1 Tax=Leeuwenhoekiella parthenopeia TaxID=2890320 RepID=A0ABS8GPS1_9FLAO|nr:sulfatase [Leeuwenhoekiella parthenopeia]MCC4211282.1 sulfatase [Leeuwenhoekiella parthenopeia]
MKTHLKNLSLLLILIMAGCKKNVAEQESWQHPNVLFINVDDMNGWGPKDLYKEVRTPYLDKLRDQSVNFTNAVCASPVCVPSRAAFFSGVAPHKTGVYYNGSDPWRRSDILAKVESMPECFKRNGYETFGRGKIFHSKLQDGREEAMFDNRPIYKGGFGPFAEEGFWVGGKSQFQSVKAWEGPDSDFPDVNNSDAAIEFLQQAHDSAFFCYLGFWRQHTPYTAPKRFFDLYDASDVHLPVSYKEGDLEDIPLIGRALVDSLDLFGESLERRHETFKQMIRGYLATTSFADWSVGRVIDALDASAYSKNTIVIVASDNGYHMGEKEKWQKGTLWELSAYSPLLIRLPNGKSMELDQTVSLMDIYPTLIDYCRLRKPEHKIDGESLLKYIENPKLKSSPSIMTYGEGFVSVGDGHYRYIQYPDGSSELYDHRVDPFEWDNVTNDPNNQKIIMRLKKEIPKEFARSLGGRTEENNRMINTRESEYKSNPKNTKYLVQI